MLTYDQYLRSDAGGKELIMRLLFEAVAKQQMELYELRQEVAQLKAVRQPLNRLAKSPLSLLPRFDGNDAG